MGKSFLSSEYLKIFGVILLSLFFAFGAVFVVLVVVECNPEVKLRPSVINGEGYAGKYK